MNVTAVLPCGRRRGKGARTVTTGWNVTGRMVQRNEFGQGRDDVGIFFTPREEHYFLRQKDALNQPAQKFPLYYCPCPLQTAPAVLHAPLQEGHRDLSGICALDPESRVLPATPRDQLQKGGIQGAFFR